MKKNIIALAVASAIAAPMAAQAAPTVYGKLNLNLQSWSYENQGETDPDMKVGSTASRIGIKGADDLGNGLKAVYKMEFQSNHVAEDSGNILTARNQYLGLAGGFGTVLMGRHDTPEKMSQPSDMFNDGFADSYKTSMSGGVSTGEIRATNVLAYVSPSFNGIKLVAATVNATEFNDANSVAVMYGSKKEGIYAAFGMTNDAVADGSATMRLSAQYKANGLTANLMHQTANEDTGAEGSFTVVQAAYKMGKIMPKLKVAQSSPEAGDTNTAWSLGVNYSLGKKTTGYAYHTSADDTAGKSATIVGMAHSF